MAMQITQQFHNWTTTIWWNFRGFAHISMPMWGVGRYQHHWSQAEAQAWEHRQDQIGYPWISFKILEHVWISLNVFIILVLIIELWPWDSVPDSFQRPFHASVGLLFHSQDSRWSSIFQRGLLILLISQTQQTRGLRMKRLFRWDKSISQAMQKHLVSLCFSCESTKSILLKSRQRLHSLEHNCFMTHWGQQFFTRCELHNGMRHAEVLSEASRVNHWVLRLTGTRKRGQVVKSPGENPGVVNGDWKCILIADNAWNSQGLLAVDWLNDTSLLLSFRFHVQSLQPELPSFAMRDLTFPSKQMPSGHGQP